MDGTKPKERTANEYMQDNPQAPSCSRCGEHVGSAGRKAGAVLCARCTDYLSRIWHLRGKKVARRACPDCGAELQHKHRYCPKCAEKRRRQSIRASQRRARAAVNS